MIPLPSVAIQDLNVVHIPIRPFFVIPSYLSFTHCNKERCIVSVILFSIRSFTFAVFFLLCSVCIKYSSEQNHFTTLNSIMSDYAMCSICHLPGSFFRVRFQFSCISYPFAIKDHTAAYSIHHFPSQFIALTIENCLWMRIGFSNEGGHQIATLVAIVWCFHRPSSMWWFFVLGRTLQNVQYIVHCTLPNERICKSELVKSLG